MGRPSLPQGTLMHTFQNSLSLRGFRTIALVLLAGLSIMQTALALDKPTERVVLTIAGNVSNKNQDATAVFSMAMLEKLPQHKVFTKSPWYPQGAEFTGPLLRDVLAAAGAKGDKIIAVALNDYKTEIPLQDAYKFDVILAHHMNGKPMPVREKGPLFIVYPFDSKPELQSEVYQNRSAWQLVRLTIQ